jgi:autotransporter-associated beta strand protein
MTVFRYVAYGCFMIYQLGPACGIFVPRCASVWQDPHETQPKMNQMHIPISLRVVLLSKAGLAFSLALALSPFTGRTADIQWQGGTASYTNTADWVGGSVPGSGDNAINDNGTNNVVQINPGNPNWIVNDFRAGNAGGATGAFLQNGPNANLNGWFRLGVGSGAIGVFTLDAGTITMNNGGNFNIGESGTGILNINGGTVNDANARFGLADGPSSATGIVNQVSGTVNANGELWVGNNAGTGFYNFSGGTNNFHNWIAIGRFGGKGTMVMSGGVLTKDGNGNFLVGTGNGSIGELDQSGGTINCASQFLVPEGGDGSTLGTYNVSGTAALIVNNWMAIGRNGGPGILNLNGGSITKTGDNGNHLDIGAGGSGTINQTNGAITNILSDTWLGENSSAVWNLEGGSATLGQLVLCVNSSASGTLNLDGGSLTVSGISSGNGAASSTLNFNGGTLRASADNSSFLSGLTVAQLGPGGAIIDSQGHNITIAQALSNNGGGGLTKNGSGNLTLAGANTYTGSTIVNGGSVVTGTGSSASGNCTAADNAGFGVLVQSAGGQFTSASLSLGTSTGASLSFDLGAFGNPTVAPLNVSGVFTLKGTIPVSIADALPQVGQFPLVKYGSLAGGGHFTLASVPVGVVANLVTNSGNSSIDLNITSVNLPRWDGEAGGNWDIGLTTNWINIGNGMATFYGEGNSVLFDDNALGTTTVNLVTTVNPSSVTVNDTNLNYTFVGAGKINGPTGLTKTGTGTLAILNTGGNSYTGPTVISGGTLSVTNLANGGSPSSVGASSASPTNLVINNATLSYSGAPVSVNRGFKIANTNSAIDAESNLTFGGQITASSSPSSSAFVKTGPAQLAITTVGTNEFSSGYNPGMQVLAGTLLLNGSGGQTNHTQNELWVGATQTNGAAMILSNTTLNVDSWLGLGRGNGTSGNNSSMTLYNSSLSFGNVSLGYDNGIVGNNATQYLTLNGSSTLIDHGDMNLAESSGSTAFININGTSAMSSQNRCVLAGSGGGNATASMTIANSGKMTVNNAWFSIANGNGSVASLLIKDSGSLSVSADFNVSDVGAGTATAVVQDNGKINANNLYVGKDNNVSAIFTITNNATVVSSNGLTMATFFNGTPVAPTTAIVNLVGGSLAVNLVQGNIVSGTAYGVFNFNGGRLIARNPFAANFMFNLAAINVLSGGAVIDSDTNIISISQPLLDGGGGGGLTKLGSGALLLNGTNTYTGTTLVSNGALAGTGSVAGHVTVSSGAALAAGAGAIGTFSISNTLTLSAGSTSFLKITPSSNDQIAGLTDVSYNGALVVTNSSGLALTPGTVYTLFSSSAPGSGNFASVTILPSGSGTFNPATGQLTIGASPMFNQAVLSGGHLIITGTGGIPGGGYTLLTSTNVAAPLTTWSTNTTGVFDGSGAFSNNIPINTVEKARFFDVRVP